MTFINEPSYSNPTFAAMERYQQTLEIGAASLWALIPVVGSIPAALKVLVGVAQLVMVVSAGVFGYREFSREYLLAATTNTGDALIEMVPIIGVAAARWNLERKNVRNFALGQFLNVENFLLEIGSRRIATSSSALFVKKPLLSELEDIENMGKIQSDTLLELEQSVEASRTRVTIFDENSWGDAYRDLFLGVVSPVAVNHEQDFKIARLFKFCLALLATIPMAITLGAQKILHFAERLCQNAHPVIALLVAIFLIAPATILGAVLGMVPACVLYKLGSLISSRVEYQGPSMTIADADKFTDDAFSGAYDSEFEALFGSPLKNSY